LTTGAAEWRHNNGHACVPVGRLSSFCSRSLCSLCSLRPIVFDCFGVYRRPSAANNCFA
jgi:hypothetical protein